MKRGLVALLVVAVAVAAGLGVKYVSDLQEQVRDLERSSSESEESILFVASRLEELESEVGSGEGFDFDSILSRLDDAEGDIRVLRGENTSNGFAIRRVDSRLTSCVSSIERAMNSSYSRSVFC